MGAEANYCKNCGHPAPSTYCANCGQRSGVYKVTFRETLHDLADNLFSLSAPLAITLKKLIVNPGLLLREYLEGKRKKYYKPISFFLLATLLYIFLRWLIDYSSLGQMIGDPTDNPAIDAALLDQARIFMIQNINNLLFIFVGVLAIVLKMFFYRRYLLAEYLAVSFYLAGFYTLLATINIFYMKYVNPNVQYLHTVAMCGYFIFSMVSFFERRKVLTAIKALVVYILTYFLYVTVAFYLSYLIVFLKQS